MNLRDAIEKIVEQSGLLLYDIETESREGHGTYRVLLHSSEGGVTLDQCEKIARLLSPLMDTNPPFGGAYSLEVSSPGVERPLKNRRHYELSLGELVKLTTKENKKIVGKLLEAVDEGVRVEGQESMIPYSQISRARTYFEW